MSDVAAQPSEAAPSENTMANAPEQTPAEVSAPAEASQGITAEQVAEFFGSSVDTVGQFKKFADNNGGFDKSFSRFKSNISAREKQVQQQQQQQQQSTFDSPTQPNPEAQASSTQAPNLDGGFTQQEFLVQQYFESLATRPEYASIADEIRNGKIFGELQKFNIQPVVNGVFNHKMINDFLSMYSKTMPAPTPQAPVTSTPTVDLVQVGDTISNMQDAINVIRQDRELRAQGREGHPMAKQAEEFFDKTLTARQNRGKRVHKTIQPEQ